MTKQEEKYIHFASCINDLNNAWKLLQEIKMCKGNSLVSAAFQFALIEYSKPYKSSRGTVLKYKLDESHIPAKHIELHKKIIGARDQIHAHSDLTVKEAKLYIKNMSHGKVACIVQNKISGTEELANIDTIIDLVEQSLGNMYKEAERLEATLPDDDESWSN